MTKRSATAAAPRLRLASTTEAGAAPAPSPTGPEARRENDLRAHFLLESIAADARRAPEAYLDESRVEGGGE